MPLPIGTLVLGSSIRLPVTPQYSRQDKTFLLSSTLEQPLSTVTGSMFGAKSDPSITSMNCADHTIGLLLVIGTSMKDVETTQLLESAIVVSYP